MVGMLLLGGLGVGSPGRWSWPWDISAPPPDGGCPFPVPGWPSVRAALLGAFGPPKYTAHDSSHQKFCFMASPETWEKFCWLIKNRLSPPWAGDSHRGAGLVDPDLQWMGSCPPLGPSPFHPHQNNSEQKRSTPKGLWNLGPAPMFHVSHSGAKGKEDPDPNSFCLGSGLEPWNAASL